MSIWYLWAIFRDCQKPLSYQGLCRHCESWYMQLQRDHHFQSKLYFSNILYTKCCRGSRILLFKPEQLKWTQPQTWQKGGQVFDPLPSRFWQQPQNHFFGAICPKLNSDCEPTVGRISVKFDTFSGRLSVHRPILNSGTRLSGVSVCQQKLWKGKYLDQNEELLGQLFGVHLERG